MAALCTGTSYGLSNLKANDNKELIFVKLTDSAFRAIEEYNRNKVSAFVQLQWVWKIFTSGVAAMISEFICTRCAVGVVQIFQ